MFQSADDAMDSQRRFRWQPACRGSACSYCPNVIARQTARRRTRIQCRISRPRSAAFEARARLIRRAVLFSRRRAARLHQIQNSERVRGISRLDHWQHRRSEVSKRLPQHPTCDRTGMAESWKAALSFVFLFASRLRRVFPVPRPRRRRRVALVAPVAQLSAVAREGRGEGRIGREGCWVK